MDDSAPPQKNPRRTIGALGVLLLAVWTILVAVSVSRCSSSPFWRAKHMKAADPCRAAALYAVDVRRDWKGSIVSARELGRLNDACALKELIELMDLPDGCFNGVADRGLIAEAVRRHAAARGLAAPAFDPSATQELRVRQKATWLSWYQRNYLETATGAP